MTKKRTDKFEWRLGKRKDAIEIPLITVHTGYVRVHSDSEVVITKNAVQVEAGQNLFHIDIATGAVQRFRIPVKSVQPHPVA